MMEYLLKGSILQRCPIDIASDPVVVKDRRGNLRMVHVIRCAGDTSVVLPRLPNKLEEVVDTGEDIIHEDDGIKVFPF